MSHILWERTIPWKYNFLQICYLTHRNCVVFFQASRFSVSHILVNIFAIHELYLAGIYVLLTYFFGWRHLCVHCDRDVTACNCSLTVVCNMWRRHFVYTCVSVLVIRSAVPDCSVRTVRLLSDFVECRLMALYIPTRHRSDPCSRVILMWQSRHVEYLGCMPLHGLNWCNSSDFIRPKPRKRRYGHKSAPLKLRPYGAI